MVSSNYSSPYFQSLPSQEVRVMPYIEPPFVPTVGKRAFPYAEYIAQDEMGPYKVNVNVLKSEEGFIIEHVTGGNLLMRVQIIREKILNSDHKLYFEYSSLLNKYIDWSIKKSEDEIEKYKVDREKVDAENEKYKANIKKHEANLEKTNAYIERSMENAKRRRKLAEEDLENQRMHDRNDPFLILGGFVINTAIATKDVAQNALILTRDTAVKTASVAKESISKVVFFCSAAWVYINSSQDAGNNGKMQRAIDMRKLIVKKIAQNTSYAPSLIAQLLCNEKTM